MSAEISCLQLAILECWEVGVEGFGLRGVGFQWKRNCRSGSAEKSRGLC